MVAKQLIQLHTWLVRGFVLCQSKTSIQFRLLVTIFGMGHKSKELVMQQRLNHFIQNRSNRTIKMSVNAVKTTRLRRASLGIVRSITPFRRNGIGPGVEGSCCRGGKTWKSSFNALCWQLLWWPRQRGSNARERRTPIAARWSGRWRATKAGRCSGLVGSGWMRVGGWVWIGCSMHMWWPTSAKRQIENVN